MEKQHYISRVEKIMVVKTHSYLERAGAGDITSMILGLRKRVGLCLGIAERSVDRILEEYSDNGNDLGGNKLTAEFVPDSLQLFELWFELWFEDLCYNSMMRYGSVRFHMDGAKYHLRNLNPMPTTSWRKDAIQQWLTTHGVEWSANMLNAELGPSNYV
ncbi:hypothetical protein P43SY_011204 [Pythium insidiosum]|uniref:Uncharacterized protein n=1 Tax=Pythium insidiosum TaxID=114742 RepID=A0AAD5L719_PYTIN|nr:hypothetical protein P43SY_011204 [Pythium insidiosum]